MYSFLVWLSLSVVILRFIHIVVCVPRLSKLSHSSWMFGFVSDVLLLLCISVWEVSIGISSSSLILSLAVLSLSKSFKIFVTVLFVCLFLIFLIFGCIGSLLLHAGFFQLWRAGATLRVVHGLLVAVASLVAEPGL